MVQWLRVQAPVSEDVEKLTPGTMLVGIYNGTAAVQNRMAIAQNIKH